MTRLFPNIREILHKTVSGKRLAPDANDNWYECQYNWPDNSFVQCGNEDMHEKAFFEFFPNDGFYIRRDAKTIEEAETKAWFFYQNGLKCKLDHTNPDNFDRKNYTNGLGFCKSCGYTTDQLEPLEKCIKCNKPTYYSRDINNDWWCKDCVKDMPRELILEELKLHAKRN